MSKVNYKVLMVIGILALFALMAAGCTVEVKSDTPQQQTQSAPEPPPVEDPVVSGDEAFLRDVRNGEPEFINVDDSTLIQLGGTICEGLASGMTGYDVAKIGVASGLPGSAVGVVIGAAVKNYCPEYSDRALDGFSNGA